MFINFIITCLLPHSDYQESFKEKDLHAYFRRKLGERVKNTLYSTPEGKRIGMRKQEITKELKVIESMGRKIWGETDKKKEVKDYSNIIWGLINMWRYDGYWKVFIIIKEKRFLFLFWSCVVSPDKKAQAEQSKWNLGHGISILHLIHIQNIYHVIVVDRILVLRKMTNSNTQSIN